MVSLFLCITQIGFCCVYFVFVAANLHEVTKHFFHNVNISVHWYLIILVIPLILMNLIKNLKYLTPISLLAAILTCSGLTITFFYMLQGLPHTSSIRAFSSWSQLPLYFGTAIYAFEGIGVVCFEARRFLWVVNVGVCRSCRWKITWRPRKILEVGPESWIQGWWSWLACTQLLDSLVTWNMAIVQDKAVLRSICHQVNCKYLSQYDIFLFSYLHIFIICSSSRDLLNSHSYLVLCFIPLFSGISPNTKLNEHHIIQSVGFPYSILDLQHFCIYSNRSILDGSVLYDSVLMLQCLQKFFLWQYFYSVF